jgi:hypothetical protein
MENSEQLRIIRAFPLFFWPLVMEQGELKDRLVDEENYPKSAYEIRDNVSSYREDKPTWQQRAVLRHHTAILLQRDAILEEARLQEATAQNIRRWNGEYWYQAYWAEYPFSHPTGGTFRSNVPQIIRFKHQLQSVCLYRNISEEGVVAALMERIENELASDYAALSDGDESDVEDVVEVEEDVAEYLDQLPVSYLRSNFRRLSTMGSGSESDGQQNWGLCDLCGKWRFVSLPLMPGEAFVCEDEGRHCSQPEDKE